MVHPLVAGYSGEQARTLAVETDRTAISIPATIAEACGMQESSMKEFRNRLYDANVLLMRLETLLILAHRLEYISREEMDIVWPKTQETSKLLIGLIRAS